MHRPFGKPHSWLVLFLFSLVIPMSPRNSSHVDARDSRFQDVHGGQFNIHGQTINFIHNGTDRPRTRSSSSQGLLSAFRRSVSFSQHASTDDQTPIQSPFSLTSHTLPEIITSPTGDTGLLGASIYTQTRDSPAAPTSGVRMLSTPHSTRSNEQRDTLFNAERVSTEPVTLDGLIEQLIADFLYVGRAVDYRDTFLTTYVGFTTADDVLQNLVRRFKDAEASPGEQSTLLRINIITAMKYWASNRYLTIDTNVLARMQEFSMSIHSSTRMTELAAELRSIVNKRLRPLPPSPPSLHPPISRLPGPGDVGIALVMLEGDRYARILPSDYISYLRHPGENNSITIACKTNQLIVNWVKYSILRSDDLKTRKNLLNFFVNTAEESRKHRNFASMSAIVAALQSQTITRLRLTYDGDAKRRTVQMSNTLDPRDDYAAYKAILRDSNSPYCIPWLANHIREIHKALSEGTDMIVIQNVPMINFSKWRKCYDRIKDVFRYKSPDISEYRQTKAKALAYLEGQLRGVSISPTANQSLEERSVWLEAKEEEMRQGGFLALEAVGMR